MSLRVTGVVLCALAGAFGQDRKPDFAPSYEVHILPAGTVEASVSSHPDYWAARGYDLRTMIATVCDTAPERVDMPASLGDKTYDFVMVLPKAESQDAIHRLVREAIEKQFHLFIDRLTWSTDLYVLTA